MRFVDLEADDVNSLAAPLRRELDAGHEADAGGLAGGARFGETGGGVVVGERERADAARLRAFDQRGRRQHAIGIVAVGVEIDEGFGAGIHGGPYDTPRMSPNPHSRPDWSDIDTVLLDLDGTLLDQAYDNHIWRDLVPQRFAVAQGLDLHAAYAEIARRFAERSDTLDWYCIEYWSRTLGVDIGALHREVRSHVAWLPGARDFLRACAPAASGWCCSRIRIRSRSP